jgi:DNA-binding transcriptional LysR family regulator
MALDVDLLLGLRAVIENGTVTQAASVLGITQPALSARIAKLESRIGFPLFDREGGNSLRPTPRALEFYESVRAVLAHVEQLALTAERLRTGATGTLVVASHPAASISILPGVVARFRSLSPGVDVRMINRTSEDVRAYFEASIVDLAIAELPVDLAQVERRRVSIDLVAILPTGHPLAARATLSPADLADQPFVSMTTGRAIGHIISNAVREKGGGFTKVIEAEYFSTICALVATGQGVSVVDPWSARMFAHLGLVSRPLTPAIRYEIAVFFRSDRRLADPARLFLGLLEETLLNPNGIPQTA